jgi:hypothetical protein
MDSVKIFLSVMRLIWMRTEEVTAEIDDRDNIRMAEFSQADGKDVGGEEEDCAGFTEIGHRRGAWIVVSDLAM